MKLPAIIEDNIACLLQASTLVGEIGPQRYTARHGAFFKASIGGHIRHNIDHYENFFRGLEEGRVDYESRDRDRSTEEDPDLAAERLAEAADRLRKIAEEDLDAPCTVRVNADSDDAGDPSHWSGSTVRRELQFLLGHAIHHHAQIAAMCRASGIEPAPEFGMAPSTLRFQESGGTVEAAPASRPCAQ